MSRLAGHELHYEGAAHNALGHRIFRGTGGKGHARCSCGATSPELTSGSARKQWHRAHKDQIRKEQQ